MLPISALWHRQFLDGSGNHVNRFCHGLPALETHTFIKRSIDLIADAIVFRCFNDGPVKTPLRHPAFLQVNGDFAYIRIQSNAEVRPFLADGFDKSVTVHIVIFWVRGSRCGSLAISRRAIGAFIQFRDDVFPGCLRPVLAELKDVLKELT